MRGLPLDGYIIFYQNINDGIEIVRIVSGKRDLKALFALLGVVQAWLDRILYYLFYQVCRKLRKLEITALTILRFLKEAEILTNIDLIACHKGDMRSLWV